MRVTLGHAIDLGVADRSIRTRQLGLEIDPLTAQHLLQERLRAAERGVTDDLADMQPGQRLRRHAIPVFAGAVGEAEAMVRAEMGDQRRQRVGDQLQAVAAELQLGLGQVEPAVFVALVQRPHDRVGQALQALLDHVVARAAGQRLHREFLGQGAGDEDEGHLGPARVGQGQRGIAVETGQHVVGEDHVEVADLQRLDEAFSRPHPLRLYGQPRALELGTDQFGVQRAVFQHQDADHRPALRGGGVSRCCHGGWNDAAAVDW